MRKRKLSHCTFAVPLEMLCLLPFLLLTLSTDTTLAAPAKEPSSLEPRKRPNTATSLKTQRASNQIALNNKKPMSGIMRHRLYRSNRFDANGREMTREEWESMVQQDPSLEAKWDEERRRTYQRWRHRSYLRGMIKKNPDQADKYIQSAKDEGFEIDDLIPGGQDKSQEAFRKRQRIRQMLVRLKKDISLIGTAKQKGIMYSRYPVETKEAQAISVEDQLINEIGRFRAALRNNPYDPQLIVMRDKLELLMRRSLYKSGPINLPHMSTRDKKSKPSLSRSSPPSSSVGLGVPDEIRTIIHPSVEELRRWTPEKKAQYIESLFN